MREHGGVDLVLPERQVLVVLQLGGVAEVVVEVAAVLHELCQRVVVLLVGGALQPVLLAQVLVLVRDVVGADAELVVVDVGRRRRLGLQRDGAPDDAAQVVVELAVVHLAPHAVVVLLADAPVLQRLHARRLHAQLVEHAQVHVVGVAAQRLAALRAPAQLHRLVLHLGDEAVVFGAARLVHLLQPLQLDDLLQHF